MDYITLSYKVNTDLVEDPEKEKLFTLILLQKLGEVYERILEQLSPFEVSIHRHDEDTEKGLVNVHVKCSISGRKQPFDVDELINKALREQLS